MFHYKLRIKGRREKGSEKQCEREKKEAEEEEEEKKKKKKN